MLTQAIFILLATASLLEAGPVNEVRHLHSYVHKHKRAAADDSTATTLAANAIQTGSFLDGSTEIGAAEVGQAKSLTSTNNFINNCAGKTLTNGEQVTTGSCNGITMGDIPAKTAMVSSIITFPLYGSATIQADTSFNISVQMSNLVAGAFTNADATYYAAPQALSGGKVVGHTHVTVQDMGASLNPTVALDPTQFAFFKGINDAGNGQGLLQAVVTGGLPAGNYRVCTMASAANHQPVLMPVAQRGTADDCTKFTVVGSGTTANAASNNGANGQAAAALAASAVAAGPGATVASSAAASSSSVSVANVKATSSVPSVSTKAGKATSSSDVSSTISTSSKAVKATTSKTVKLAATAPFANSSIASTTQATTTKAAKTTKATLATTIAAASSSTSTKAAATKTASGKGNTVGNAGSSTTTTIVVKKVTVIETFFEFVLSLGGLPPSVGKNGDSFIVLEETFTDITEACAAACTAQYTTCISFSGPGFSFEECNTQKESCVSAASTASASSTPATLTATVTVPPSATITGSIISETTLTTTVTASATSDAVAAVVTQASQASTTGTESICGLVSSTIFVDAPTATLAVAAEATISTCPLVTSTVYVDAPSATASVSVAAESVIPCSSIIPSSTTSSALAINTSTLVADTAALGGIAAPAVTDSGDATRPFLVNGNTFVNKAAAVQRSCDIQFNACANAFNGGTATGFNLSDCQEQEDTCINTAA